MPKSNSDRDIVRVSLEDFLRNGIFGPLEFAMTADEIVSLLGSPDSVFTRSRNRRASALKYGDVEFHFMDAKDDRLATIYLDHFENPKGSGFLSLDCWRLRGAMSQSELEIVLTQAGIAFHSTEMPDLSMDGIVTAAGVKLGFIRMDEEFSPPAGLFNISRSLRAQLEIKSS